MVLMVFIEVSLFGIGYKILGCFTVGARSFDQWRREPRRRVERRRRTALHAFVLRILRDLHILRILRDMRAILILIHAIFNYALWNLKVRPERFIAAPTDALELRAVSIQVGETELDQVAQKLHLFERLSDSGTK